MAGKGNSAAAAAEASTTQRFKQRAPQADTTGMTLKVTTLDLIAREFAGAVASGDLARAEGWFATAEFVNQRAQDRRPLFARSRGARSRLSAPLHLA